MLFRSLVDERSRRAKQAFACQGTGRQRVEVMQEVTEDLIYELLGQILPSGAREYPGDLLELISYISRPELFPQARGKS